MILTPKLAFAVSGGRVTLHREPRTGTDKPYRADRSYAVQGRAGREAICRVVVHKVIPATVDDLTFEQARAAGYRTTADANDAWAAQHGTATTDVWVIEFALDRSERPVYLAQRSEFGYTNDKRRAMPGEPEVIDRATLSWITTDARDRMPVGQPRKPPPTEPGLLERVEQALREELRTRFRGVAPEDIAAESPKQGTPGEIKARRRAMGLRAIDGLFPVPADQVDELVASMIEEGCSVRDIALALDCSPGKAHQIVKAHRTEEAAA